MALSSGTIVDAGNRSESYHGELVVLVKTTTVSTQKSPRCFNGFLHTHLMDNVNFSLYGFYVMYSFLSLNK